MAENNIDVNYIRNLRDTGFNNFNWTRIANIIGVSRSTILRWRYRSGYEDSFRRKWEYIREELNEVVASFLDGHYERGDKMVIAHVKANTDLRPSPYSRSCWSCYSKGTI